MMRRMKILIPVMLAVLLALMPSGCSCAGPAAESETERTAEETEKSRTEKEEIIQEDPAGQYEITEMITDGKATPPEDMALLKGKGLTCTIALYSDGTGVLDLFGEESDMTWNEETISTKEKTMPYTISDEQLILTDGDSSLTFSRTELPEDKQ